MRLLPALLALAFVTPLFADTVTLSPSDDTSLMESSPEDDFNFGAQRDVSIGTTGSRNDDARSRGLFRFDIASAIPAGSTINSGEFSLTVERSPAGTSQTSVFQLHRMLVGWIEGAQINNERPGGSLAAAGEPAWNLRAAPSDTWGALGGLAGTDFSSDSSASASVLSGDGRGDTYQWPLNATGVTDLQNMLDTPGSNFGWMLKTTAELTAKTARRFYMKETLTDLPIRQGLPPQLIIDFTPPTPLSAPDVTVFSYNGTEIVLGFFASAGVTYEVQISETLNALDWSTVETFDPIADGILSSTISSAADTRRFVRILASDS